MDWHHKKQPPFHDHLGIKVDEWRDGYVVISATVKPEHFNSQGVPHGGFITTLIDVAGSYCGLYCPHPNRRRKALTLSLNTNFTGQAKTNTLKAIGKLTSSGRRIYYSYTEVFDSEGTLIATGQMNMRYRSGSETLEGVPVEDCLIE